MKREMRRRCRGMIAALILLSSLFQASTILADNTAMFELGNEMLQKQNYPEALAAYENFVRENPHHRLIGPVNWTITNIYTVIYNDYEKAAEVLQRMVSKNLNREWQHLAYDRLGRCFEEQQKWEKAVEVYRSAIEELSFSCEDAEIQERARMFRRRLLSNYRNMNDYDSIIRVYQEMLAENPASSFAAEDQFHLAQACLVMNRLQEAANNFALVVERYPASDYAQRVQLEQKDFLTSELGYDWTPFSTFQSALRLSRIGQCEEAVSRFDEIIDAKPNTGLACGAIFQKLLIEYRENGNASALLEKVASSPNEHPYLDLSRIDYFLSMIVEAQQVVRSDPNNVAAYVRMGVGYYQTQAYQCGIDSLTKAITMHPRTPDLYNLLGYCYVGLQEYDEAISAFQKLIDIDPHNPNWYDSLAEAYYHKGHVSMAIQFYQKSLAIDSSFSNPYYMLGTMYQELGKKQKAVEHLEKYLQLDPSGYQSQNARGRLSQLKPHSSNGNNH